MRIEVLYIDDCPNSQAAIDLVHQVATVLGLDHDVITTTLLRTDEEVAATQFAGSPTILVNGNDIAPGTPQVYTLACRLYRTEAGAVAGLPTVNQLLKALQSHQ